MMGQILSDDALAAEAMEEVLVLSGWSVHRVHLHDVWTHPELPFKEFKLYEVIRMIRDDIKEESGD
jgi:hypothetical protein